MHAQPWRNATSFACFLAGLLLSCGSDERTAPESPDDPRGDASARDAAARADAPRRDAPHRQDARPDDAGSEDGSILDGSTGGEDASLDAGWDPTSGASPPGKGIWIWKIDRAGLTATEIASRAAALGIAYVLIKSGQDANYWETRYTAEVVYEFTRLGLLVFAWPYITPNDIPGSIDAAVMAANVPGTSGIVLDVEVEWEEIDAVEGRNRAQALCQGIRAGTGNMLLGYTSWGWPRFHPGFPFATFNQYCSDVYLPQVYWADRGVGWEFGLMQAREDFEGWPIPVWMVQSNDDLPSGAAPSTADLNYFFDEAGEFTSLWQWPASAETDKLLQLSSLHFENSKPMPTPRAALPSNLTPKLTTLRTSTPDLLGPVTRAIETGDAAAFARTFLPHLAPRLTEEVLRRCRTRLGQTRPEPDWETRIETVANGRRTVEISLFGKGMTSFHEVDGVWRADRIWCLSPYDDLAPLD